MLRPQTSTCTERFLAPSYTEQGLHSMIVFSIFMFGKATKARGADLAETKQVVVCCNWPLETGCEIIRGINEFTLAHPEWDVRHMFVFEEASIDAGLNPDGVISSVPNKDLRSALGNIRVPIVALDHFPRRADVRIDVDQEAVGRQAAEHLIARNFSNFAYLSLLGPSSEGRERGFRQIVSAHGGTIARCEYEPGQKKIVSEWLQSLEKPTGVFCFNDYAARDLLSSCRANGIRVPEEIAIVGADNEPLWCEMSRPQITSVAIPWRQFGYQSAAALEQLMSGKKSSIEAHIKIKPIGVVTRQSTDSLAISDPELARVLSYLREHAFSGLTLNSLLRKESVNVRWLQRKCREHLGHGPHEEILRVQIERAKTLLSHTALQVKDIAAQVGLSRAHFTDTFTKSVGSTPSAWRQANRL